MTAFDREYFLVFPPVTEDEREMVALRPDRRTAAWLRTDQRTPSSRPLFFHDGFPEMHQNQPEETALHVLFSGIDLVLRDPLHEFFREHRVADVLLQPAVFVDASGGFHEDYWYVSLYEPLDAWDRERSDVLPPVVVDAADDRDEDDDDDIGDGTDVGDDEDDFAPLPRVRRFSLHTPTLEAVPEEHRLVFTMGGVSNESVFVHQRFRDHLESRGARGIRFFRVDQYRRGMENFPPEPGHG